MGKKHIDAIIHPRVCGPESPFFPAFEKTIKVMTVVGMINMKQIMICVSVAIYLFSSFLCGIFIPAEL